MSGQALPSIRQPCERGFTLIELLVGLALMGMAASLLLAGLHMAGLVTQHVRTTAVGLDEMIAVQRLLRTEVERVRPITRIDSAVPIVDLRGTKTTLTFIAPPLGRDAPDALQRFRLARTANGELVLYNVNTRKSLVDRSGTDLVGWTPATLLHGVSSLSISYFGPSLTGAERVWQDDWWDRSRLPELIRVRVDFVAGDGRYWPDLMIRPRATSPTGCVINNSGRCEALT